MEKIASIPDQHSNCPPNKGCFFQAKLEVNEPGDTYEQEADAMADRVMHMPASSSQSFFKPSATAIQRKCKDCEEEDKMLQRKETGGHLMEDKHDLDNYVDKLDSSGQPLTCSSRQIFEPHFGYDFSNVRVHTDDAAAQSARSVRALAYTTGNHIVFNQGQYAPDSEAGQKLMAHELTHVVQQNKGVVLPKSIQRQDENPDAHPLQITKHLQLPAPDTDLPEVLASPENKKEDEKPHLGIDFSKGVSANPPLALRPETYSLSLVYRDWDIHPGDDDAAISVDLGHEPNLQLTLSPDPHNAQIYQAAITAINIHFKRHKKEFIELGLSPQFTYSEPSHTFSGGAQAQVELHVTSKFSITASTSISGTRHDATAAPDYSSVSLGTSHGVDWSWSPVSVGMLWHLGK